MYRIAILFLIKGIVQFVSFIAIAYLSNKTEKQVFIDFIFLITVIETSYTIFRLGIPEYGIYKYYKTHSFLGADKIVYSKNLIISLIIQIIAIFIYFLAKIEVPIIILLSIGLLNFINTSIDYNQIKSNLLLNPIESAIKWVNIRSLIFSALIILIITFEENNNIEILLCMYILSFIFVSIFIDFRFEKILLKKLINIQMVKTSSIQGINSIYLVLDFYLIKNYFGDSAYEYAVALRILPFISIGVTTLSAYQASLLHNLYIRKIYNTEFFKRSLNLFIYLILSMVIALIIFDNKYFPLKNFFGNGENISILTIIILALPKLIELIGGTSCSQLIYLGFTNFILFISTLILLIKFIIIYSLIDYINFTNLILISSTLTFIMYIIITWKLFDSFQIRS